MKLEIHIERLVLEGLPVNSAGGHHVQRAVQAELARLLGEAGLAPELQAGGSLPHLKSADIGMTRGDKPAELGQRIAQAVHGAIATKSRESRAHRGGESSPLARRRSSPTKGSVK